MGMLLAGVVMLVAGVAWNGMEARDEAMLAAAVEADTFDGEEEEGASVVALPGAAAPRAGTVSWLERELERLGSTMVVCFPTPNGGRNRSDSAPAFPESSPVRGAVSGP